jgi:hypothetical protein
MPSIAMHTTIKRADIQSCSCTALTTFSTHYTLLHDATGTPSHSTAAPAATTAAALPVPRQKLFMFVPPSDAPSVIPAPRQQPRQVQQQPQQQPQPQPQQQQPPQQHVVVFLNTYGSAAGGDVPSTSHNTCHIAQREHLAAGPAVVAASAAPARRALEVLLSQSITVDDVSRIMHERENCAFEEDLFKSPLLHIV